MQSSSSIETQEQPKRRINLDALLKLHLQDQFDVDAGVRPDIPPGSDYVEPDSLLEGAAHCVFELEHTNNNTAAAKIYLGSKKACSRDVGRSLESLGIKGIVNCTHNLSCYHRPSIKYCVVPVQDVETAEIHPYFWGATAFLHHFLSQGNSVLVHCQFGVSRSATIVLAYLMRYHKFTRDEAFCQIKQKRPQINPNDGFWKQLQVFEDDLRNRRNDNLAIIQQPQQQHQSLHASIVLFSTWRDVPELLESDESASSSCWSWLQNQTREQTLNASLDFVWGRGLNDNDLEWLKCVCHKLSSSLKRNSSSSDCCDDEEEESSIDTLFDILENPDSEFCSKWAGEVTRSQILKVQRFLLSENSE